LGVASAEVEGECSASNPEACAAEDGVDDGALKGKVKSSCVDTDERCGGWAEMGECDNNPNYMKIYCPISCDTCPETYDLNVEEKELLDVVAEYGKPQKVEGMDAAKTFEVIRKTVTYMQNEVHSSNPTHQLSVAECINRDELCAFWAAIGECEANKAYMKVKCAPSCQSCDMIDIEVRCPPLGDDVRPGLLPGELNAMFERIVNTAPGNNTDVEIAEGMTNFSVVIHSGPRLPLEKGRELTEENDMSQPPWIITFDNFLTDEECNQMIQLGYKAKYERSKDVGEMQIDGSYDSVVSKGRTSENAWCSFRDKCRNTTTAQLIHDRISTVTGIPANHSEDFQILKYEKGQFYRSHHDYIEHQEKRRCGPRVLTFFLYLSDVEEGGDTNFPKLSIAVKPKKGSAVLWPSVLDSNPSMKDPRTDHEAQEVVNGTKFGANAWLHLHDYMAAQDLGCT